MWGWKTATGAVGIRARIGALGIRTRILLFLSVTIGTVLLVALAAGAVIRSADYHANRVQWAHKQLEAITELDVYSNRYSEQIAEMLLIGPSQRPDLESARSKLTSGLEKLEQATRGEIAFLSRHGRLLGEAEEIAELSTVNQLRTLALETDRQVQRALALRETGKQDEAIRLFEGEIEERLDDEFQTEIAKAFSNEREQVTMAEGEAAGMRRQMALLVAAVSFLVIAVSLLSGYFLHNSLARPIRRLREGAIALGRGDLSYRIGQAGPDELGLLAAQFDAMAGQLKTQQSTIRAAQSDLETQIGQRTAELERANQRLRMLDRQRIQFLAEISHELRTPLTVLRGEAEVTLRAKSMPQASYRETLSRIIDEAHGMGKLVDDLLFLSRAESDTLRFESAHVDLREVLAETVRDAEVLGRGRNVKIETRMPNAPVVVEGDRQRLKQAMMIALDNAVKYSEPRDTVPVSLTVEGDQATVAVRNRGMGLEAEELSYVFEYFYRGRAVPTKATDGSGLGLPIAKWILEKHGGSINLTSKLKGFTELSIRLPVIAQTAKAPHDIESEPSEHQIGSARPIGSSDRHKATSGGQTPS